MTPQVRVYENRPVLIVNLDASGGQNLLDVTDGELLTRTLDLDQIVSASLFGGLLLIRQRLLSLGRLLSRLHGAALRQILPSGC